MTRIFKLDVHSFVVILFGNSCLYLFVFCCFFRSFVVLYQPFSHVIIPSPRDITPNFRLRYFCLYRQFRAAAGEDVGFHQSAEFNSKMRAMGSEPAARSCSLHLTRLIDVLDTGHMQEF